jgi:CheY-like chemotaxis protein
VLVIDDNVHMRSLFRAILGGFGIRRVHEAADGADGLAMMVDRRPDIAICDWLMEPLNGAEFMTILRRDSDSFISTTPVILVSADARRQVVLEAARLGVNEFLAKPVSPATLYQRIIRVLQASAARKGDALVVPAQGARAAAEDVVLL